MNYNMQGMTKTIPELFAMLKSAKVEIKKKHQVLMVDNPLVSSKREKEKKGNFKKNGKQVATPVKKPKARPKTWNWVLLLQRKWSLEAELPKKILGG